MIQLAEAMAGIIFGMPYVQLGEMMLTFYGISKFIVALGVLIYLRRTRQNPHWYWVVISFISLLCLGGLLAVLPLILWPEIDYHETAKEAVGMVYAIVGVLAGALPVRNLVSDYHIFILNLYIYIGTVYNKLIYIAVESYRNKK